MTKLDAVNEVLEAIGEQAALELDTGGTSDVSEAETHLDRATKKILRRGWASNRELNLTITRPTVKLGVSVSVGTFTLDQVVTQAGSGATGTFAYEEGGFVYLRRTSGTFASTGNLSVSGGGVTRVVDSYAEASTSKIPVSEDWIAIMPAAGEPIAFVTRGGFLYDPYESTAELSADVTALVIQLLDFTDLTHALAKYIIAEASATFQRFKNRGQFDEALLQQAITEAKVDAEQEDSDLAQTNVLNTQQTRAVLGGRGRSLTEGDPNYA